jgi:hypothetical protein
LILWLIAALAIGAALLLTNPAFKQRQIARELSERVGAVDRFVDIGVTIKTVVADPEGSELIEGKPRLRVVDTWYLGGIVDTKRSTPQIVGPSQNRRVWYASPEQADALKHNDTAQLGQLIYGSEGAGKTRLLAMWHYVRWVKSIGERREGGQTAPTTTRLKMVRDELLELFSPSWFTYSSSEDTFTMCDGTTIKLVSTYRQSAAQGSPVQGFNWSWCGRDEAQDQIDVHEDIESRGRSAKDGHYWQLATATAKDDPHWRTLRSVLIGSGQWLKRDLSIFRSPFVTKQFLATKRASMTDREFRRRYGNPETGVVEDLAPELALYFGWDRKRNLRPIPITAKKITSIVLSKKTGNRQHALLAGHDPGSLKGATIYLDAYQVPGRPDPVWWVRKERMHRRQTTEQSGLEILKDARDLGCNIRADSEIVHVRAQPVGQSDDKPSEDLYRIFKRIGLDVRAAQYKKDGTGTGHIKKDDRIELLNWLFEKERLFVACDDHGRPAAPNLVTALESMQRDERGRAETERKDSQDLSDCPAALGYALWPFEKSAASALQADVRRSLS